MAEKIVMPALGCPKCGRDMGVKETRSMAGYIRRRRVCLDRKCDGRITTIEIPHPGGVIGLEDPLLLPRTRVQAFVDLLQTILRPVEPDEY